MDIYSIKRVGESFEIIDQTLLPEREVYLLIDDYKEMIDAIKKLKIRGAPLLGIAATAAAFLAAKKFQDEPDFESLFLNALSEIENSRPTAVNLFHAIDRIRSSELFLTQRRQRSHRDHRVFFNTEKTEKSQSTQRSQTEFGTTMQAGCLRSQFSVCSVSTLKNSVLKEKNSELRTPNSELSSLVDEIMQYEYEACEKMAMNGLNYIPKHFTRFLTHCNTGSLATYGAGTALGVLKEIAKNRDIEVFVDETRPLLQGARLTMWELQKAGINCTLITDNMAAWTIKTKNIQAIIVGADRIAQNGDTANKIGTLNLAILAKHFQIPFYIVAPETTIDRKICSGQEIIIEEREGSEVLNFKDVSNWKVRATENTKVFNPAFDITPFDLITAIINEK